MDGNCPRALPARNGNPTPECLAGRLTRRKFYIFTAGMTADVSFLTFHRSPPCFITGSRCYSCWKSRCYRHYLPVRRFQQSLYRIWRLFSEPVARTPGISLFYLPGSSVSTIQICTGNLNRDIHILASSFSVDTLRRQLLP